LQRQVKKTILSQAGQNKMLEMKSKKKKKIEEEKELFSLVFFYFFLCTIPNITAMYKNFFLYIFYILYVHSYILDPFFQLNRKQTNYAFLQKIALNFFLTREREKHICIN
jgi:hypothetical protein